MAGRGREYRGGDGWRKKTVIEGNGREYNAYAHARMGERERCRGARRDAGERTRRCISCFIGPSRPMLVTEVGWAVVCAAAACAREGGRRKTRMRLMIYTPATVYYRLELRPRLPSFRLPLFFFSPLGRSPALSASHFLRLSSLVDTPTTSTYFT